MKKKFLILTLVCVLTLSLAACLTACSHKHTLTKVDAVDATCTATGNSEYYKCTDADCGKFFSDAEGTEEIEKDSWVIAAKGHSYGEWTVEKAATFFGKGVEKRVCANDASHTESRDIAAIGSTAKVFDSFTVYADASKQGDNGIILNKDIANGTGASTYFGETDKNYDWDGSEMTLAFELDLSALSATDDYTMFVLAFNYKNGDEYTHADEIRFGIVKTDDGFVVNRMDGAADDAANVAAIKGEGSQSFTASKISASFTFAYDADTKEFTYSMTIGGKAFGDITRTELNDLVGLRYLWNARLNKDGVELSNLTLA